jgi:hypothetical protein
MLGQGLILEPNLFIINVPGLADLVDGYADVVNLLLEFIL